MNETVAEKCPGLVCEWDYEKNTPLLPSDVTTGSHRKVWWKGSCGHEWQAIVKNRVRGAGCPFCSGNMLLRGFNDLATLKPELISEWSEKNTPITAHDVLPCSNKDIWWRCFRGHEWIAKISDRYYGSGCPYCAGHKLWSGYNDLESLYPHLAVEWSDRNDPLKPEKVFPKSRQNVWWKCRICGYEWRAVIDSRVKGGSCPVCAEREIKNGVNDLVTTDPYILCEWDYDRNKTVMPSNIGRNSLRIVWWKGKCGHRWRAKIADRVIDHEPCRVCKKEFDCCFPDLLLRHYAEKAGCRVVADEEGIFGIPLTNFLPEKRAVIEISKASYNSGTGYRRECAKTAMCQKDKIKLIRILKRRDKEFEGCVNITRLDDTDEALADAIAVAFGLLRIEIDTDVRKDKEDLLRVFLK